MQIQTTALAIFLIAATSACARRDSARDERKPPGEADRSLDSAARKAGKAAHELADETREAAKKAAVKLKEAGREAREGWNEAKKDPKDKK